MGDSAVQTALLIYLTAVCQHMLRDVPAYVAINLNIYTARHEMQHPIAPDLAIFFGVRIDAATEQRLRNWCLYEPGRPPPAIVIEVASESTWRNDLRDKPARYAELGVAEYILYDPNAPALLPGGRLRLWRRAGAALLPVPPDTRGRCWSTVLERYLVSDGAWLRLTDRDGVRCPTAEDAERAAKKAARAAEDAARAAEDAERAAKEAAWAKLRELGIDPTTLI